MTHRNPEARELRCETCLYMVEYEEPVRGTPMLRARVFECRRFPPTRGKRGDMEFPPTAPAEWCGEWAAKP